MVRFYFLFFLISCFGLPQVFSQDSLVRMKDLKFSSDLERSSFIKYFRDKDRSSLTTLLLSTNETLTAEKDAIVRNQINALGNSLTISGIQKRKPQRKVKEVYDFVHRTTLKKYELECRFDQLPFEAVYANFGKISS